MSDIFLSHSSDDNDVARKIKDWLETEGHECIFLDFQKESGIAAGRDWERTLYRTLQSCRAVIVLCNEASMNSRWVFAEITHARALGKHIFPIRVGECELDSILSDRQAVDLADGDKAFRELAAGLGVAGIDVRDSFRWDPNRSPYPGLLAFDEEDAAIFFGRSREIGSGLDLLQHMRRYRNSGMVLVLGASGSGKSSLVRAGLLPRLRKDVGQWLIVGPIRPQSQPESELAGPLTQAFEELGQTHDASEIRRQIHAAADAPTGRGPLNIDPLTALGAALSAAAKKKGGPWREDAHILLVIDQFEELLGDDNAAGRRFLAYLRRAIEAEGSSLILMATMRSDFLGTLQQSLSGFDFRSISVGPMDPQFLPDVIQQPANLANLEIDPELVDAIQADAESEDALSMVAFTLRELYEGFGRVDRHLRLSDYREKLGGLRGSIARAAEAALTDANLNANEKQKLRQAFLGLAQINDDGQITRRTREWGELPALAHNALERFVQARLLVAGGNGEDRTLEVAHEALFRVWNQLADWLSEGREELQLSRELKNGARAWTASGRNKDYLLRGSRLERTLELHAEQRLGPGKEEMAFLKASKKALRKDRRQRRLAVGFAVAFLAAVALSTTQLWWKAERETERTQRQASRVLAVQARTSLDTLLDLSLLLSLESFSVADTFEARTSLNAALQNEPRFHRFLNAHGGRIWSVAFSPDGATVGSADETGNIQLWDLTSGRPTLRFSPAEGLRVLSIAFHPNGRSLAAGSEDGTVSLWTTSRGQRRADFVARHAGRVLSVAFDPAGHRLASGGSDNAVRVWSVASGDLLYERLDQQGLVWSVAFQPNGKLLASGGVGGKLRLHNIGTGDVQELPGEEIIFDIAFSPDGTLLASGRGNGSIDVWDVASGRMRTSLSSPVAHEIRGVRFSPDGKSLAAAVADGTIVVWDIATATLEYQLSGLGAEATDIAFDPYGRVLAAASGDGALRIWDVWKEAPDMALSGHKNRVVNVVVSGDGQRFVSSDIGGTVLVREVDEPDRFRTLAWSGAASAGRAHNDEIWGIDLHPDGRTIATSTGREPVRLWDANTAMMIAELGPDLEDFVWDLAFSPDGRYLAAADESGLIRVWHVDERRLLHDLRWPKPGGVYSLAFSPGSSLLASSGIGGTVYLWNLNDATVSRELTGLGRESRSVAFSADGTTVAAGDTQGTILLWEVESGQLQQRLEDLEASPSSLQFRRDGLQLLSGTSRGFLWVWSRDDISGSFEPLMELLGHNATLRLTNFDPLDENRVVSASNQILWWDLENLADRDTLRRRVCDRAGRNLTLSEWQTFISADQPRRNTCPDVPGPDAIR